MGETARFDFRVGDEVEVLDEGLARLRQICPEMPPNHHGRVHEIKRGRVWVEFPIDGSYEEHSQVVPYPEHLVRVRK